MGRGLAGAGEGCGYRKYLSTIHSVEIPRALDIPRNYNAADDLVDGNLKAGRARQDRLHRRCRPVHLRRTRRAREPLRQPPAVAGPADGGPHPHRDARFHRLAGRLPRRDQGRHRAGRGQHAAHAEGLRVHALRQPRQGAARLPAAEAAIRFLPFEAAVSEACSRSALQGPPGEKQPRPGCRSDHPRRRLLLAVFLRFDRHAQGHGARAFQHAHHRRALRATACWA